MNKKIYNTKNKKDILSLLAVASLLFIFAPVQAIEHSPVYNLAYQSGRNFHVNAACILPNGDYYVVCENASTHAGTPSDGTIASYRSTDGGDTWVYDGEIVDENPVYGTNPGCIGVSPNGTVINIYQEYDFGINYQVLCYQKSYDNGTTWTASGVRFNASDDGLYMIPSHTVNKDGVMYVSVGDYHATPLQNRVYTSEDNGETWSSLSIINVSSHELYPTLDVLPNGNWVFMDHHTQTAKSHISFSYDDCVTWTVPVTVTNSTSDNLYMRSIDLEIIGNTALIHGSVTGLGVSDRTVGYYNISVDNITNPNWGLRHDVTTGCGDRGGYTSGIRELNGSLFLVFSDEYSDPLAELKWSRITNISQESESEDETTLQFISIEGGGNGTTIYTATPMFNWTIVENTIQYQLQIATDSGFNSLVVNIIDINEANYPAKYDENATRVSFTLPDANGLDAYDVYYCRVRAKRV